MVGAGGVVGGGGGGRSRRGEGGGGEVGAKTLYTGYRGFGWGKLFGLRIETASEEADR